MPKILSIDDKEDNLISLSALLKNLMLDCTVITAQSGLEGIEKAKEEFPDTILLDIKMPEMDGFEVCKRLKSDQATRHIPVIMLTTIETASKSRIKGLNIGADAFLFKPIDGTELVAQLNVMLRIKKVEDALRNEKKLLEVLVKEKTKDLQLFRNLINQSNDAIFVVATKTGSFLDFNYKACNSLGYEREELLNMRVTDIEAIITDDFAWENHVAELRKSRYMILESKHKRKDGTTFPVEINVKFIIQDEREYIVAVARDITKRRQAEEEILKSKAMLQEAFDGIPEPTLMLDKEMRIKVFNRAAVDYYKTEYKDVIGELCYQALKGRAEPCDGCDIPSSGLGGECISFEQKGLTYPEKIEKVDIYPVKHTDNEVQSAIVRVSDITEQRKMEKELLQADKMISLGILVSGVAHEINNPNNFIMLNTPLLSEAWDSIAPILEDYYEENGDFNLGRLPYSEMRDEIPKLLNGIKKGSKRIKRIVQDLKDYSRQNIGKINQTVNVNEFIESAISLVGNMIKKSTNKFSVEYGKDLPVIKCSKQKLEQVIINLIQNACQALPDKSKGVFVKSLFNDKSGNIVVEVRDEGIGINEKVLPRIMDPFYTTRRSYGGTGLGLSVSANIIKEHGGKIEVKSQRGEGSIFAIFLPTKKTEEPIKILVVDDDSSVRDVITTALREKRYYLVKEASSGVEACVKLGSDCPNILILDIQIPDMDGVEICRLIKAKPELSGIKVIVITGFPDSTKAKEIVDMGFKNILPKPFRLTDLLGSVEMVLKGEQSDLA